MKITVHEKKLQNHKEKDGKKIYGLAWGYWLNKRWIPLGRVDVDPRQSEKELMDTLAHEVLHLELPDIAEESVERAAESITAVLRKAGFGKVKK